MSYLEFTTAQLKNAIRAKAAWLFRILDHTQLDTPGRTPLNCNKPIAEVTTCTAQYTTNTRGEHP
jgi:hypothetical protein